MTNSNIMSAVKKISVPLFCSLVISSFIGIILQRAFPAFQAKAVIIVHDTSRYDLALYNSILDMDAVRRDLYKNKYLDELKRYDFTASVPAAIEAGVIKDQDLNQAKKILTDKIRVYSDDPNTITIRVDAREPNTAMDLANFSAKNAISHILTIDRSEISEARVHLVGAISGLDGKIGFLRNLIEMTKSQPDSFHENADKTVEKLLTNTKAYTPTREHAGLQELVMDLNVHINHAKSGDFNADNFREYLENFLAIKIETMNTYRKRLMDSEFIESGLDARVSLIEATTDTVKEKFSIKLLILFSLTFSIILTTAWLSRKK